MQDLALGIDIGGTNTVYGIVSRRGEILAQDVMPTKGFPQPELFIAALAERLRPMMNTVGKELIAGVGIGAPNGNYYTGEIANAANLEWEGTIPLARLTEEALELKATVTNDANAATMGEMMYGAARGMKDFIMVTLGTGLGSGFVANGQLVYGHDGFAGELGHVVAVREGRSCGCGRQGCLETYASATGIVRTANEWLGSRATNSSLKGLEPLSARDIGEAAAEGDALALELFEYTGKILGQCLADIIAITSPQAIILFGGLANAGDLLFEPTRRHIEASVLRNYKGKVNLLPSSLPDADAAILGASALVWQSAA
jgi:glucokinase